MEKHIEGQNLTVSIEGRFDANTAADVGSFISDALEDDENIKNLS